jgi:hypothetical protein
VRFVLAARLGNMIHAYKLTHVNARRVNLLSIMQLRKIRLYKLVAFLLRIRVFQDVSVKIFPDTHRRVCHFDVDNEEDDTRSNADAGRQYNPSAI